MPPASTRPRVLVATSNFPLRERGDMTGNFVVDPILALAGEVDHVVVAPLDTGLAARRERFAGRVDVHRFRYWPVRSQHALAYGQGIPAALATSWLARLQLLPFVVTFALTLLAHARHADVIHAHWLQNALLALPAARLTRTPLVVTLHGTDVTQFPSRFVRWALGRVDVVVSAHDDLLATARELQPATPRVRIRHLVEPQPLVADQVAEVRSRLGDGPLALFVARLSPERDPLTFVRAAPHLLAEVPGARLAVVGDGPLRDAVESEIDRLGLRERVHTFGYRADVWTFLSQADAFAAISDRNNAWVTAMVEAMRAGVPVVATSAGDTARALTDGHDALLVPVGDELALAEALRRLLTDEDLATRIAAGAHETLHREGFGVEDVRAATLALYRRLAAGVGP
ncbi:MAG TPA: glycosyltransferase [Nitriliruptorales bacterium]